MAAENHWGRRAWDGVVMGDGWSFSWEREVAAIKPATLDDDKKCCALTRTSVSYPRF